MQFLPGDYTKTKQNGHRTEDSACTVLLIPGPVLIIRDSRIKAKRVVVKWTVPSSATGMFIRTSFWTKGKGNKGK